MLTMKAEMKEKRFKKALKSYKLQYSIRYSRKGTVLCLKIFGISSDIMGMML